MKDGAEVTRIEPTYGEKKRKGHELMKVKSPHQRN